MSTCRVVLFTGKGGVGKTTTAAATAVRCAEAGQRVLIMSADPAHSLADSFEVPISGEPTEVGDTGRLLAVQLDARERLEASWGEIRDYLREWFHWAGVTGVEAEELAVLPGMDEVFALADLDTFARSGEHDLVIVDCAPTAETIRLLSLPDVMCWFIERLMPPARRVNRLVGPVVSRLTSLPTPRDDVFVATRRLYEQLSRVRELLAGPGSTVRLVVNPERMVINEARRTHTYLSLFGYPVDAVILNRMLPEVVSDPFFAGWRTSQQERRDEVIEAFSPLPVLESPLATAEVRGMDSLRAHAAATFGDLDPAAVLHPGVPLRFDMDALGYPTIHLELPFTDKGEVDVAQVDDELVITVGPYRRNLVLPDSLAGRAVTSARMDSGVLVVAFATDRDSNGAG